MILKNLAIDTYRGLSEIDFDDLAPVTLLVGGNNTGKTSIIEAAALLMRPFDPLQWMGVAQRRELDSNFYPESLWDMFPSIEQFLVDQSHGVSAPIVFSGELDSGKRTLSVIADANLRLNSNSEREPSVTLSASVSEQDSPNVNVFMEFQKDGEIPKGSDAVLQIRSFTVTPVTHRSTRIMVDYLSRAIDDGQKKTAVEMSRIFDPEIEDLDISSRFGRTTVRVTHRYRGVVDLTTFGDGLRRSAALALAATRSHGGLLLIDEIEAGLHTRVMQPVMKKLVEAARHTNTQILATTHSLEAVDALLDACEQDPQHLALFFLQNRGMGLKVRRYEFSRIAELRESGVDLR